MINSDIQKLVPGNIVTLFEVDCTGIGGSIERYHNHNDGPITWQGKVYEPWAIKGENFERTGDGQQPFPSLKVSNIAAGPDGEQITGVVTALCLALDDLLGAKVTRKRTFVKYLDAVNFEEGNPSANPNEHFPDELWTISRKSAETPEMVEFELSSPLQFDNIKLPSRQVIPNLCGWLLISGPEGGYRGAYCGYTGNERYDLDGNRVFDPSKDRCSGLMKHCELRFGKDKPLSFGGFPSSGRV